MEFWLVHLKSVDLRYVLHTFIETRYDESDQIYITSTFDMCQDVSITTSLCQNNITPHFLKGTFITSTISTFCYFIFAREAHYKTKTTYFYCAKHFSLSPFGAPTHWTFPLIMVLVSNKFLGLVWFSLAVWNKGQNQVA